MKRKSNCEETKAVDKSLNAGISIPPIIPSYENFEKYFSEFFKMFNHCKYNLVALNKKFEGLEGFMKVYLIGGGNGGNENFENFYTEGCFNMDDYQFGSIGDAKIYNNTVPDKRKRGRKKKVNNDQLKGRKSNEKEKEKEKEKNANSSVENKDKENDFPISMDELEFVYNNYIADNGEKETVLNRDDQKDGTSNYKYNNEYKISTRTRSKTKKSNLGGSLIKDNHSQSLNSSPRYTPQKKGKRKYKKRNKQPKGENEDNNSNNNSYSYAYKNQKEDNMIYNLDEGSGLEKEFANKSVNVKKDEEDIKLVDDQSENFKEKLFDYKNFQNLNSEIFGKGNTGILNLPSATKFLDDSKWITKQNSEGDIENKMINRKQKRADDDDKEGVNKS